MPRAPRSIRLTLSAAALLAGILGCTVPPSLELAGVSRFRTLSQTMDAEVDPLVEKRLPLELVKDANAVDYPSIQGAALRIAGYFRDATIPGHTMYLRRTERIVGAKLAETWFRELANAAERRDRAALVLLMGRKRKICSSCHDY
ncbi:MAG: hypothetical protein H6837_07625 [Planctomycetes bacterium]|nr:hypothetical protein [Planctomycetota bacterium]